MNNLKATRPSPETLMFLRPPCLMLSRSLRLMVLNPDSPEEEARERLTKDGSKGLFEWCRTDFGQGQNRLRLTFRDKEHNAMRGGTGGRERRNPLLRGRHKKVRLEFAETHLNKPKSFWENILWTNATKLKLFGTWYKLWYYSLVLGALNLCVTSWNQEITMVSQSAMINQCHKAATPSEVTSPPAGQWAKTHTRKHPGTAEKEMLDEGGQQWVWI